METSSIFRDVPPLKDEDCFLIISRQKNEFNFPVHVHPEFELNFVINAAGAQRIVGDSIEEIGYMDLCLIANGDLEHAWQNHKSKLNEIHEITIHFEKNFFLESFMKKKQFHSISVLFENAKKGMVFSESAISNVKDRIIALSKSQPSFFSVIELLTILYELSTDIGSRTLCSSTFTTQNESSESRRVQKVIDFIRENYYRKIHLEEVATYVGMTEVSFSRFLKKRTGKNYIEYLNDIRLGNASRLLVNTTKSISEISYDCGFNNISNFNRIFLKRKGITPNVFRTKYSKMRLSI